MGKRYDVEAIEGRVVLDAVLNSTMPTARAAGTLEFSWAATQLATPVGVLVGAERFVDGATKRRRATLYSETLSIDESVVLPDGNTLSVFFRLGGKWCVNTDSQWELRDGVLEWYVESVLERSWALPVVVSATLTPGSMPLVGIPPLLGATAGSGATCILPPMLSKTAFDRSAKAIVLGGYRVRLVGGDWLVYPAKVATPSSEPCGGCEVVGGERVYGSDCWSMTVVADAADRNAVTDLGTRAIQCRPPCISMRSRTEHLWQSDVLCRSASASVLIVPHVARRVVRAAPGDHAELVRRWGFPRVVRSVTSGCSLPCTDVAATTIEEEFRPQLGQRDFVARALPHSYESAAFGQPGECLPFINETTARAQGVVYELVEEEVCAPPFGYTGSCAPRAVYLSPTVCCSLFGVSFTVQRRDGAGSNPELHPYFTHPAPGFPDAPMSWAARYANTWCSPHWQFHDLFPLDYDDDEPFPQDEEWPLYGARANPSEYWIPLKTQKTTYPSLPSSEARGTRLDIVSQPLGQNRLRSLMEGLYGSRTSWWGSATFRAVPVLPPESVRLSPESAPLWSSSDATLSYGATRVTVTPTGGEGPGVVVVDVELGSHDVPPYWYAHQASSVEAGWDAANVDALEVRLVGADGAEVVLGTTQSKLPKLTGEASTYAGDYVRKYSPNFDPSDEGADVEPGGSSPVVCADSERLLAFELLPAQGAKKLRLVVECADRSSPFMLHYPAWYAATGTPWLRPKTGQTFVAAWPDGPAVQLGETFFYDHAIDQYLSSSVAPVVAPFGRQPTMVDGLSLRRLLFDARDREDGLDDEIASWLEPGLEYVLRKDLYRDPALLPVVLPPTHSWWMTSKDGGRLVLCLSYSMRETPPCGVLPEPARDDGWQPTEEPALETVSYCAEPRWHMTPAPNAAHLEVDGDRWTVPDVSAPSGWVATRHDHATTDAEGPFAAVIAGGVHYGDVTPWHGYYLVPGVGSEADGPTCASSDWGEYWRAAVEDGRIRVWSSAGHRPPFDRDAVATAGPDDRAPCLAWLPRGHLVLAFEREGGVYVVESYDRGVTFLDPVLLFTSGSGGGTFRSPRVACSPWNATMVVVFQHDTGSSGPGTLHARFRAPGDTAFGASSALPFSAAESGHDVCFGRSRASSWIVVAVVEGEEGPSEWESADDGVTWRRVP